MIDKKLREEFANDIRSFADNKILLYDMYLKYKDIEFKINYMKENVL